MTRAWGVTSQRPVWCGDGPARPPRPGPSRYVLHQLRSPRKNGAKRPTHLITPSRTRAAHSITRLGTHARAAARASHMPPGPRLTPGAPARAHSWRDVSPTRPRRTRPRKAPSTERTSRLFRHHIPAQYHLAHGWGSGLPFTHGWKIGPTRKIKWRGHEDRTHPDRGRLHRAAAESGPPAGFSGESAVHPDRAAPITVHNTTRSSLTPPHTSSSGRCHSAQQAPHTSPGHCPTTASISSRHACVSLRWVPVFTIFVSRNAV